MKIAITGGTGYVGTRLISKAVAAGHGVTLLGRGCHTEWGMLKTITFDIDRYHQITNTLDADVIIHLAMRSLNEITISNIPDIEAAKFLASLSSKINAGFIYISSQTANTETTSIYGKTKRAIEKEIEKIGGLIIRPGQVYGGEQRGLFGKLVTLVNNSIFLPKIVPAPLVQPIHIDELIDGILKAAERPWLKGKTLNLGSTTPIPFNIFLDEIAKGYLGVGRIFIPIPASLIRLASKLINSNNLRQVISLLDLKTMETSESLRSIGLSLRSITDAMISDQKIRRRKLLLEARTILRYVSRNTTPLSLKTYVRNIELNANGRNLNMPKLIHYFPVLLSAIDNLNYKKNDYLREFFWRLNCAIRISEASTEGAKIFMALPHQDGWLQFFRVVLRATTESFFWISIGLMLKPIVKLHLRLTLNRKHYGKII